MVHLADIFEPLEARLREVDISARVEGGGRIEHDMEEKKIIVYGYSVVN